MIDRDLVRGDTFAGRYEISGELGRGAYGVVYDATDVSNTRRVALKLLKANRISLSSSRWREASALRRLNVPGVARLLDEGHVDGTPFVVMEFIDGESFPTARDPLTWTELRPLVVRLLDILSLVHGEGVVHGDLKPSNVMVSGEDVVLLDFGLATSIAANEYESGEGSRGTPIYMAPEVFADKPRSSRSDLFAVGTMIFEALTGQPFFPETSLIGWIRRISSEGPPQLASILEDADQEACRLVDALLMVDPFARPGSATEAIELLENPDAVGGRWLGPRRYLPVLRAIQNGESVDVVGPRGTGGSRMIEEALRHFRREGGVAHQIGPGERPYESFIRTDSLELSVAGGLALDAMEQAIEGDLKRLAAAGHVFVVPAGVDRWSAALIDGLRAESSVVRRLTLPASGSESLGGDAPGLVVRPEPYTVEELEAFFDGPETALHLRSRPAKVLWKRTLGYPRDVFAELDAWTRFGMCHLEKDRVRLTPRSLELLEQGLRPRPPLVRGSVSDDEADLLAWIRLGEPLTSDELVVLTGRQTTVVGESLERLASRRLVAEDEAGWRRVRDVDVLSQREPEWLETARRRLIDLSADPEIAFRLALVVGDETGIVECVGPVATAREERGDLVGVQSAYRQAVMALRAARSDWARDVVLEWGRFALWRSSSEVIEEVLWAWGDHDLRFSALLEGKRRIFLSPGEQAATELIELGRFGDPNLEAARTAGIISARRWYYDGDQTDLKSRLNDLVDEVDDSIRPRLLGSIAIGNAFEKYGEGDFAAAARLNLEAARVTRMPRKRLSLLVNAGWGLMDAFEYAEAKALAGEHLADAATYSQPDLELQFVAMKRYASYRLGDLPQPSEDVIAAALEIGYQPLTTTILACEAGIAWRLGERERAADLASRGAQRWHADSRDWPSLVVTYLHAFLDGRTLESTPAAEGRRACPYPRLKAQMLGFASYSVAAAEAAKMRDQARSLVPADEHHYRLECFAIDEIDGLDRIGKSVVDDGEPCGQGIE